MSTTSHRSVSRTSGAPRKQRRTELSEMVTQRARETEALVASIRVHKAEVAAALRERLAPALRPGESLPDHELTLELAGRSVELAFDRLEELDERHRRAKAERAHFAGELERVAKQELYPRAVSVRRQIDDALGREAGSELHTFTGKTPRVTARLKAHVERAVSRLGGRRRELPATQDPGQPVDRAGWKRRLEAPLRALDEADEQLVRWTAELNAAGDRRQQAMQQFDAVYNEALHLAEAAYLMAGIGEKMIKSLRSGACRRRLARRARQKREARAGGQDAGPAPSEARPAATARRPAAGVVTAVSRWFRRLRGSG